MATAIAQTTRIPIPIEENALQKRKKRKVYKISSKL